MPISIGVEKRLGAYLAVHGLTIESMVKWWKQLAQMRTIKFAFKEARGRTIMDWKRVKTFT